MQTSLFAYWLRNIVLFPKPTENKPFLLILSGHSTHTENIEVIDLARQNIVYHCTHRLQPVDVTFMKPLSSYYCDAARICPRSHPDGVVSVRLTIMMRTSRQLPSVNVQLGRLL